MQNWAIEVPPCPPGPKPSIVTDERPGKNEHPTVPHKTFPIVTMVAQQGYRGESGGGRGKPGNSEPEKRCGRFPDTTDVRNLIVK